MKTPENVEVGDGHIVIAKYQGTVIMKMKIDGKVRKVKLHNVLYVPDLKYNLVSVSKATMADKTVIFDKEGCTITDEDDNVIATARKVGDLFYLNNIENEEETDSESEVDYAAAACTDSQERKVPKKKIQIEEVTSDEVENKVIRKLKKNHKESKKVYRDVMKMDMILATRNEDEKK